MSSKALTIGHLATAASVGVETIRYYQKRKLIPVPQKLGAYRQYPFALIGRIHFIKRAQEPGFALNEISSVLELQDGTDRKSIRSVASDRVIQIDQKLADWRIKTGSVTPPAKSR